MNVAQVVRGFDEQCSFLICVNHVFDIYFIGNEICKYFEELNNIVDKKCITKEY